MIRTLFYQYSRRLTMPWKKSPAELYGFGVRTIYTGSPTGMEKLDSIWHAVHGRRRGFEEYRQNYWRARSLSQYPEIDWKGAIGFRDLIAHHYFDIDAEQVFWICDHEVRPLSVTIKRMMENLR